MVTIQKPFPFTVPYILKISVFLIVRKTLGILPLLNFQLLLLHFSPLLQLLHEILGEASFGSQIVVITVLN